MFDRKKILFVYSDRERCKAAALALRAAGFQVLLAVDGREAVRLAQQHAPHAVVVDMADAPAGNSDMLRFAAEQQGIGSGPPAVIITNQQTESFAATVSLPLCPAQLVDTVKRAIVTHNCKSVDACSIPPLAQWDRLERELERDLERIDEVLLSFEEAAQSAAGDGQESPANQLDASGKRIAPADRTSRSR